MAKMANTTSTHISRRALALAGGAFSAIGLMAGAAASASDLAPNPDAKLIAACRQHIINMDALQAGDELEDDDPLWIAYDSTRDAISEAKPQTLDGILAKAQAAMAQATDPSGLVEPAGTMAEDWAWDLVNDLLRIEGRA